MDDRRRVRAVDRWWTTPRGRPRTRPRNRVACRPAVQAGRTGRATASPMDGMGPTGPTGIRPAADGAEKADGQVRPTGRTPIRPTGSDRWADRAATFDG